MFFDWGGGVPIVAMIAICDFEVAAIWEWRMGGFQEGGGFAIVG